MTKEEKIKEVYPSDYHHSDVNGWIRFGMYMPNDLGFTENEIQINENIGVWRPKSLQGIENNNGWIKIESEEQYNELENGNYEWYNINTNKYDRGDLWEYGFFTHYKIIPKIEKPKPPIY